MNINDLGAMGVCDITYCSASEVRHPSGISAKAFFLATLKGCRGIVFTHGVWMDGRAGSGKKFVWAVSQKS